MKSQLLERSEREATASVDSSADGAHILWVNEGASLTGGAEHYIFNTARLLRERGVRNTLLYGVEEGTSPSFTDAFDGAFPLVEAARQLDELRADLLYAHRVSGERTIRQLTAGCMPSIRFLHDHKLFCLREHKYTAIGSQTCTRRTGLGCYACLGFLHRTNEFPGVGISSLGSLQREQDANRTFDAIAVGSDYMNSHAVLHGFDPADVHTLPLYALPPELDADARRERGVFLFAGALLRGKGLDVLLKALASTRSDARLLIAGDGRQSHIFRQLAAKLNLNSRVTFLGRLKPNELARRLRTVTGVIAPSRSPETFGLSGLEALSFATPVIGAEVGGMGEWLRHEETGLFFPSGDHKTLAESIDRLADDHELAERLGRQGRRLYLERFTPERHVDRLQALFRSLIKGRTEQ